MVQKSILLLRDLGRCTARPPPAAIATPWTVLFAIVQFVRLNSIVVDVSGSWAKRPPPAAPPLLLLTVFRESVVPFRVSVPCVSMPPPDAPNESVIDALTLFSEIILSVTINVPLL